MKKNELERLLQRIPRPSKPKAWLEQYPTPANIAADILFTAYASEDIQGKTIVDLGCGNGIFAIGAKLLGAEKVTGVDIDPDSIAEARKNAELLGVEIELVTAEVRDFAGKADTVLENPPFGAQKRGADRPFLEKALKVGSTTYSLHMADTIAFLERWVGTLGGTIRFQKSYKFEIPHMFEFHDKKKLNIDVVLLCIDRIGEQQ